jgi:hypothetical protein
MVNGKDAAAPLHQCVCLTGVFLEPYEPAEPTRGKAKAGPRRTVALSLKAGGYVPVDSVPDMTGWPLLDRLRYAFPYVRQLLPTTDDLLARVVPPPYGQFAVPWRAKAAIATAEAATKAAAAGMITAVAPVAAVIPGAPAAAPLTAAAAPLAAVVAPVAAVVAPAVAAVVPPPPLPPVEQGATDEAGKLLPAVRMEVYTFNASEAFGLPNESYQLDEKTASQGLVEVRLLGPASTMVCGTAIGDTKKFRRPRMGGTLVMSVTAARALDTPAPTFVTLGAEMTLWGEHLINAPSWFLPLNEAICRGTVHRPPVPMVLLASVHRDISLSEQRRSAALPDGLLTLKPQTAPLYRLRDHVQQYAIEVSTQATLDGRFSKGVNTDRFVRPPVPGKPAESVMDWYNDAFDSKPKCIGDAIVRYNQLNNAEGCTLLDLLMGNLPDADRWPAGTRFYALPLYDAPAANAPPTVPLDGPREQQLAVENRPRRVSLTTPAAGDAYVLGELVRLGRIPAATQQSTPSKALADALAARPACIFQETPVKVEGDHEAFLPYFCFLAVTPVPAAAGNLAPQPALGALFGTTRTRAGVVRPDAGAPPLKALHIKPEPAYEEEDEDEEEEDDSRETVDGGPRDASDAPLLSDAEVDRMEVSTA